METSRKALRLTASVCLLALAACSSGGGGGASLNTTTPSNNTSGSNTSGSNTSGSNTSGSNTSGTSSSSSNTSSSSSSNSNSSGSSPTVLTLASSPPPCSSNVCITAPGAPTFGSATPVTENGTTPNFITSLPPTGASFPLTITGRQISLHTVSDANVTGGTLTYRGVSSGNLVIDLNIPGVSLSASNLVMNATATQPDGSSIGFTMAPTTAMSYLTMGTWRYFTASGVNGFDGAALTGYQTQAGHVPTSGTASYIGMRGAPQGDIKAGGVTGTIWYPPDSGPSLISSGVSGNATLNINFGTGSVAGQLTNMTVGTGGGGSAAWNDVNLSGSLSGASMSGTTSTPGQPASAGFSPSAMSSAATGTFKGALYGPNANEVGAIWTLFENSPNGGKSAVGVIAATHQ